MRVPFRIILALALAAIFAGCGFQLRQAPDFAFNSIFVGASDNSTLGNELKRSIASGGKVQVLPAPQATTATSMGAPTATSVG